ncbi:MAG: glycosyltransferase [Alphaproteobacteria bacterium]|nr:glycosyltransferase [Alphaproteobacteria bacterium]
MLISIVIPTLDCAATVGRAVRSVLEQDAPVELIVVDGGSTDGTPEVVRELAGDRARLIVEPDGGYFEAVAKGLALATGEVTSWLGGDDFLMPHALSLVARVFDTFPTVEWLSSTQPMALSPEGNLFACAPRPGFCRQAFLDGAYGPSSSPVFVGAIQQEGTFWRASLWRRAGARFDPACRRAVDFELWGRFFALAELHAVPAALAAFCQRDGQLSGDARYGAEVEAVLARHRAEANWVETPSSRNGMRAYEGRFVTFDPSLVGAPFVIIDEQGPSAGLKAMIRMGVIA